METTEIIRILRQCGDCCLTNCEDCPDYKKAEEGFRKDPDAKGFMWSCGGVLLDAADRLEELSELLNEWEPVVHGKVEALVVHAHWISAYEYDFGAGVERKTGYNCSRCGLYYVKKHKHCPDCGAHMDEEVVE